MLVGSEALILLAMIFTAVAAVWFFADPVSRWLERRRSK